MSHVFELYILSTFSLVPEYVSMTLGRLEHVVTAAFGCVIFFLHAHGRLHISFSSSLAYKT